MDWSNEWSDPIYIESLVCSMFIVIEHLKSKLIEQHRITRIYSPPHKNGQICACYGLNVIHEYIWIFWCIPQRTGWRKWKLVIAATLQHFYSLDTVKADDKTISQKKRETRRKKQQQTLYRFNTIEYIMPYSAIQFDSRVYITYPSVLYIIL